MYSHHFRFHAIQLEKIHNGSARKMNVNPMDQFPALCEGAEASTSRGISKTRNVTAVTMVVMSAIISGFKKVRGDPNSCYLILHVLLDSVTLQKDTLALLALLAVQIANHCSDVGQSKYCGVLWSNQSCCVLLW